MLAVTRKGKCLRFPLTPHATPSTKGGRRYVRLSGKGDGVVAVVVTVGHENVCLATHKTRCLIFPVDEVNVLAGAGKGVQAIKLAGNDHVLGYTLASAARQGCEVETNRGASIIVRTTKYEVTKRGGRGRQMLKRGTCTRWVQGPVQPVSWGEDSEEMEEYAEEEEADTQE